LSSLLHASDAIRDIATTNDGGIIAIATNSEDVYVGTRAFSNPGNISTWNRLNAQARRVATTEDGIVIAICSNGSVWAYSPIRKIWKYFPVGTTDLTHVNIIDSDKTAIIFDADGRVISLNLAEIRNSNNR